MKPLVDAVINEDPSPPLAMDKVVERFYPLVPASKLRWWTL